MDRAKFLAAMKASAVRLVPVQVKGWDEPVYLRPMTIGDVTASLSRTKRENDPYTIQRGIASMVRDERGELLFDPEDDQQMAELAESTQATGAEVLGLLQKEFGKLNESDAQGN